MQLQAMLNMNSADKNLARPRMMTEQFLGACICQKINKLTDKEQQHVRKMSHFLMLGPKEQSQYVFFYFNILSSNLKMETVGNMFSQGKMSVNKSGILLTKKTNVMVFLISVTVAQAFYWRASLNSSSAPSSSFIPSSRSFI